MSAEPLHHHHDWHSPAYVEDWINQDVTGDERRRPALRRMAALIPGGLGDPVRVLDVGGGYGALSLEVLDVRPLATVILHDYSTAMIAKAAERLAGFGDRIAYCTADMAHLGWEDELGGPFDAVVSALAIHNMGGTWRHRADLQGRVLADSPGRLLSELRPAVPHRHRHGQAVRAGPHARLRLGGPCRRGRPGGSAAVAARGGLRRSRLHLEGPRAHGAVRASQRMRAG